MQFFHAIGSVVQQLIMGLHRMMIQWCIVFNRRFDAKLE